MVDCCHGKAGKSCYQGWTLLQLLLYFFLMLPMGRVEYVSNEVVINTEN